VQGLKVQLGAGQMDERTSAASCRVLKRTLSLERASM
jgi:hypothetical protein